MADEARRPLEGGAPDPEASTEGASRSDDFLRAVARAPHVAPPGEGPAAEGATLGRFRITAKLGQGGMGVVYAARDAVLGRAVALKVLPAEALDDPERRERFLREARAASAIAHPNLATVFEAGEAGGAVYIAMELVEGRPLRALLREASGPLPPAEAVRIARGIASGLAKAHEAGIVHRDVKPENVMLGPDGAVKVLDFGLAKWVHRPPSEEAPDAASTVMATSEGRILGTPAYMSPEQARGRPVDRPSDVFSLGVVLYEMVTGARPFQGGTTMELLIAINRDAPAPARSRNPRIPAALGRILDRALAKDPAERYADCGAFGADLDRLAAEEHAVERPPAERGDGSAPEEDYLAIDLYIRARHEYRGFWAEHLDRSIALFEQASAIAPDDPNILSGMASALARRAFFAGEREIERAHAVAARAARAAPHNGEARLALGSVLFHRGDAEGAARELRQAVLRSPGHAEAHAALGRLLAEVGAFDEAIRRLEAALALDPDAPLARPELLRAHALLGRWAESDAVADGLRDPEGSVGFWTLRARVALWRGQPELAERHLRRIAPASVTPGSVPELLLEVATARRAPNESIDLDAISNLENAGVRRRCFRFQIVAEAAAYLGDDAVAIGAIDRAAAIGLLDLAWLERCPLFDRLRRDPSYPLAHARVKRRAAAALEAYRAP